ncbi:MAG: hypothetical protein K9L86_01755 [Candidatus Omnitrophica bacterium]|nr:hypothetical protein [Candidatus Omnitrophota bacterium]
MDFKNSKKTFTLIEIVIIIVIIAVLATIMIPVYLNTIEKSKRTACETNQRVLLGALELYSLEHTVLPASLSQLPDKYYKQAWAKVLSEPGSWKVRLAYAISEFSFQQLAYAASDWLHQYISPAGPVCPSDRTPPPMDYSYGLSFQFFEATAFQFRNANPDDLVIADSNDPIFWRPEPRHKSYGIFGANRYGISITRGNKIIYYPIKNGQGDEDAAEGMGGETNRSAVSKHECKVKRCATLWQTDDWGSCVLNCESAGPIEDDEGENVNEGVDEDHCFIATAAYGTVMAQDVRVLSEFRDKYLLNNSFGKRFVGVYYRLSPPAADYIRTRPYLRRAVRAMLKPVVWLVGLSQE